MLWELSGWALQNKFPQFVHPSPVHARQPCLKGVKGDATLRAWTFSQDHANHKLFVHVYVCVQELFGYCVQMRVRTTNELLSKIGSTGEYF